MTQNPTTIYIILVADVVFSLAMQVNDYIAKGYKPQGGIADIRDDCCGNKYYQAMIKEIK
jgi:hypothetical protein